jgi:hypothetical protein
MAGFEVITYGRFWVIAEAFVLGFTNCADLFSSFEPCCAGEVPRG